MIIKPNSILLFQGDSVTDCYRDRLDDSKLGNSYVPMIYEYLKQYNIKVINKAIAGNRVDHLLNRFEKEIRPFVSFYKERAPILKTCLSFEKDR
jgi:lysophospholipase L1-like esterase